MDIQDILLNDMILNIDEDVILQQEVKTDSFPELETLRNNLQDLVKNKNRDVKTLAINQLLNLYTTSKYDTSNIQNIEELDNSVPLSLHEQISQNIYQNNYYSPVVILDKNIYTPTLQDKIPDYLIKDKEHYVQRSFQKLFSDFISIQQNKSNLINSDLLKQKYKIFNQYNFPNKFSSNEIKQTLIDQNHYNISDQQSIRTIGQIYDTQQKVLINGGQQIFIDGFYKQPYDTIEQPYLIQFTTKDYIKYLQSLQVNQKVECDYNGIIQKLRVKSVSKSDIELENEDNDIVKLSLTGEAQFECFPIFKDHNYHTMIFDKKAEIIINNEQELPMQNFYNIFIPSYQQLIYLILKVCQPQSFEDFLLISEQLQINISLDQAKYKDITILRKLFNDFPPINIDSNSNSKRSSKKSKSKNIKLIYNRDLFKFDDNIKTHIEYIYKNYKNTIQKIQKEKLPKPIEINEIQAPQYEEGLSSYNYNGFKLPYSFKNNKIEYNIKNLIESQPGLNTSGFNQQIMDLKNLISQKESDTQSEIQKLIKQDEYDTYLDNKQQTSSQIMQLIQQQTQIQSRVEILDSNLDYEQLISNNMDGIAGETAPYGFIDNGIKRSLDIDFNKLQLKYQKVMQQYLAIEAMFGFEFQVKDIEYILQFITKNKEAKDLQDIIDSNRVKLQSIYKSKKTANTQKLQLQLFVLVKKQQLQYDYLNIVQICSFMALMYYFKYQYYQKINVQQSISKFFSLDSVLKLPVMKQQFKFPSYEKFIAYLIYNAFEQYNQYIQQLSQEQIFKDVIQAQKIQIRLISDTVKRSEELQKKQQAFSQDKLLNYFYGFLPIININEKILKTQIPTIELQYHINQYINQNYPIKYPLQENTIYIDEYYSKDQNLQSLIQKFQVNQQYFNQIHFYLMKIQYKYMLNAQYRQIKITDEKAKTAQFSDVLEDNEIREDKQQSFITTEISDEQLHSTFDDYILFFEKLYVSSSAINTINYQNLIKELKEKNHNLLIQQFINQKIPYYIQRFNNKKIKNETNPIHISDKQLSQSNKDKIKQLHLQEPMNKFLQQHMVELKQFKGDIDIGLAQIAKQYRISNYNNDSLQSMVFIFDIISKIILNKQFSDKINIKDVQVKQQQTILLQFTIFIFANLKANININNDTNLSEYRAQEVEKAKAEKIAIYQNIPKEEQLILNKMIELGLKSLDDIVRQRKETSQGDEENEFGVVTASDKKEEEIQEENELPDVDYDEEDIGEIYEDYSNDNE